MRERETYKKKPSASFNLQVHLSPFIQRTFFSFFSFSYSWCWPTSLLFFAILYNFDDDCILKHTRNRDLRKNKIECPNRISRMLQHSWNILERVGIFCTLFFANTSFANGIFMILFFRFSLFYSLIIFFTCFFHFILVFFPIPVGPVD